MLRSDGRGRRRATCLDRTWHFVFRLVQAIEEPFLLAVKETLGHRCNRRVEALFEKTIRYILTLIVVGFKQTRRRPSYGVNKITEPCPPFALRYDYFLELKPRPFMYPTTNKYPCPE